MTDVIRHGVAISVGGAPIVGVKVGNTGPPGPPGPPGTPGPPGEQGEPGTSVSIVGSVPTAADLPTLTPADAGDGYITENDGHLHVWSGTAWSDVGTIAGPPGAVGPRGPIGPAGPQGIQGPAGSQGNTGPAGTTGAKGDKGDKGDPGSAGTQGIQGVPGTPGTAGSTGPQGPQGDPGPQGPKGDTGNTGPAGASGSGVTIKGTYSGTATPLPSSPAVGDMWILGSPVPNAAPLNPPGTGTKNPGDGITWTGALPWVNVGPIQGPVGPQGPQGNTGSTGSQGPQGETGAQGPPGTTGAAGPGLAVGGSAGQVAAKIDGTNYNTQWKTLVKADVGLGSVDNTADTAKPVSTAQAAADALKADKTTAVTTTAPLTGTGTLGANLTLGVNDFTATARGTVPNPGGSTGRYLKDDGTWTTVPTGGTPTTRLINTTAPLTGGGDLSADRTLQISNFTSTSAGAVPNPTATSGRFLMDDGTWAIPSAAASGAGNVFAFSYNTTTTAPPTGNQIRGNNATFANSTTLWVSETTFDGLDVAVGLGRIKAGFQVYVQNYTSSAQWALFNVLADAVDSGTYWTITVTPAGSAGAIPSGKTAFQSLSAAQSSKLFSTTTTIPGLTPGANGVGGTYYLNGAGGWSVPAGGGGGGITTDQAIDAVQAAMSATAPVVVTQDSPLQTIKFSLAGTLAEFNTAITDADVVANTRAINTTAPLSGGGALSADRTLSIQVSATDRLLGRSTAGAGVAEEIVCTPFARTILDDTTQAIMQATLGVVPGTNVQAQDAELQAIAGLTSAADRLPYFTGLGTASLATFTGFGRTLVAATDAATAKTALVLVPGDITGLGTLATKSAIASADITDGTVANGDLATMGANTIKGSVTGTGAPVDLSVAQAKTMLNLTGTNSGDQTITLTGEVTGTGTGSFAATIAANAVTNAKLATMAANTVKMNNTAGVAVPTDVTVATLKTALNLTGTNSGDQTSIVGITGTIAQFNTAVSDADLATIAGTETLTGKTLTAPTMTAPVLGTPASGTLTNCTGLPVAGITASTATALGVGTVELGHASDTTLSRSAAGRLAVEGVDVALLTVAQTLTNKTLTAPTMTAPVLGTPASGTLTNCTGLPMSAVSGTLAQLNTAVTDADVPSALNGLVGVWKGTAAQYAAIGTKDANTIYAVSG